jgi:hypothetical protein
MTHQLLAVLREGFEGPASDVTYYLDADGGLRTTLAALTPDQASRSIGGNSVAAHAHHILFSFGAFGDFIAGVDAKHDWNESWRVAEVDEAQWAALQSDLAAGYDTLRQRIENADKSGKALGGTLGAITHLAYHVGAIRQKVAALRAS